MPLPSLDDITKLLKGALTIEAQEKIMELRVAALEFQSETLELKGRVAELEAELSRKKSLRHIRQLYWTDGDTVPFCPVCYESQGKLHHLLNAAGKPAENALWQCHTCNHYFVASGVGPFQMT